jgi:NADH dehydrogenase
MCPTMHRGDREPHLVIIGGGFGGLELVRNLRKAPLAITLVDRRNYHLFQPLLYQVATGALSPANIAAPLRNLLRKQRNVRVLLGDVVDIDVGSRRIVFREGTLPFDLLVVAAGSTHSYFGHNEWERTAPGLKSIEDATAIRRKVLLAFEEAEKAIDPALVPKLLTFVICGAGPTGVELAGAIAEIAKDTLRHEFRHIDPASARVVLVEAADRVLPAYPPDLSQRAREMLERLGVQLRTLTRVKQVEPDHVALQYGDREENLPTRRIFWAAGVEASPLAKTLAAASGVQLDRAGRIPVQADFTIPGCADIFVIGDMALVLGADGKPLPGVAPVAMQEAQFVGREIMARLTGAPPPSTFAYHDRGSMATIGRLKAVADLRGWHFAGALAWFIWLFVHLMQLVQFESRLLVLIQWTWHYFTRNRSARLITGEEPGTQTTDEAKPLAGVGRE